MEVTTRSNTPFPIGTGAAGETNLNRAAASVHGAVDKVAAAADDAARKVKPAIDRVAEVAHQTVDQVAGAAAPTAAWLSEQACNLRATRRTWSLTRGSTFRHTRGSPSGLQLQRDFSLAASCVSRLPQDAFRAGLHGKRTTWLPA